jgi:hypothetical protein
MDEQARALAGGVEAALPGWVERSVARIMVAYRGEVPPEVAREAAHAGQRAGQDVAARVRSLLAADVDAQATTPLAIVRGAVRYPTEVLRQAGVPPVVRDEFAEARFPEDDYGLTPASWEEVDPALADLGMAWGAAKARAHRQRHGAG